MPRVCEEEKHLYKRKPTKKNAGLLNLVKVALKKKEQGKRSENAARVAL
jgi:hypothetical protein